VEERTESVEGTMQTTKIKANPPRPEPVEHHYFTRGGTYSPEAVRMEEYAESAYLEAPLDFAESACEITGLFAPSSPPKSTKRKSSVTTQSPQSKVQKTSNATPHERMTEIVQLQLYNGTWELDDAFASVFHLPSLNI
jgi:hypothetical protein